MDNHTYQYTVYQYDSLGIVFVNAVVLIIVVVNEKVHNSEISRV